jgi:hypothetical protein
MHRWCGTRSGLSYCDSSTQGWRETSEGKGRGHRRRVGNNGITLHIAKSGDSKHVGTLRFGRAKLRWSKARTRKSPKEIPIEKLIEWLEEQ